MEITNQTDEEVLEVVETVLGGGASTLRLSGDVLTEERSNELHRYLSRNIRREYKAIQLQPDGGQYPILASIDPTSAI